MVHSEFQINGYLFGSSLYDVSDGAAIIFRPGLFSGVSKCSIQPDTSEQNSGVRASLI